MRLINNPLLQKETETTVDIAKCLNKSKTVFSQKTENGKRLIKRLVRKESAAHAVQDLTPQTDIFGFTKGQFSLIELIDAILNKTGPAHLILSTWTAATADLSEVLKFLSAGKLLSAQFLLDFSFQRRQPEVAQAIRNNFGKDSVRVTKNHAKFFLVENATWALTCKTSMNLNTNPRFEDFDLSNDRDLYNFIKGIVYEIFQATNQKAQGEKNSAGHWEEWKGLAL